jgi:hypothetical protein
MVCPAQPANTCCRQLAHHQSSPDVDNARNRVRLATKYLPEVERSGGWLMTKAVPLMGAQRRSLVAERLVLGFHLDHQCCLTWQLLHGL